MLEQVLLIAGATIIGLLGSVHLVYTFFTRRFEPRDAATAELMKATSPLLTRETTMWRAWVGFNASHSLGAIGFAVFLIVLAIIRFDVIRAAPVFAWLAVVNGLAYLALAKLYWFRVPLVGIALANICFLAAAVRLSV